MRRTYQLLSMTLCLSIMSCNFGNNNSPDHSTEGRQNEENKEITNTTNYKKTGNLDAMEQTTLGNGKDADSLNENWNLDDPRRKQNLFSQFNMSENQIQEYEAALRKWKESEKDDAYKILSANEKIKEEDKILKSILDDKQYEKYKTWAKANDQRP